MRAYATAVQPPAGPVFLSLPIDDGEKPGLGPAEGVHGDPRRSSAELGQLGVDLIVAESVDAIRKATSRR